MSEFGWSKFSKTDLKRMLKSFAAGSLTQASMEAIKIPMHVDPLKFPLGWHSYNLSEELLEGGIAAAAGAAGGNFLYKALCATKKVEPSLFKEQLFTYYGAIIGYDAMAFLGLGIHILKNVHDVKWGPFT